MRRILAWSVALALLGAAGGVPARAQSTLDLARREGQVVWYTSVGTSIADVVCKRFNETHPGIRCVMHRDGSGRVFERWVQEARSKIYTADVIHTSDIDHFVRLRREKQLMAYRPAGTERYNPAFLEPGDPWMVLRAGVLMPVYNTAKVRAEEAPKSWLDFHDPKWRGKIVTAHPGYSGYTSVGVSSLVKALGWEYLDKLAAQKPRVVQAAVDAVLNVARGEGVLSSGGTDYTAYEVVSKGEPVQYIFPKEGLPFITSPQAILVTAPHPNAAKVFSDWIFSLEGQQILVDGGAYSGHPDVVYPKGKPPLKDLKLLTISPEEAVKMKKPLAEYFRKKFGV